MTRSAHWFLHVRRFGAVYGGLYCLTTPQIYLALRGGGLGRHQEAAESWAKIWSLRPVRAWIASHALGRELGDRFDGGDDAHAWAGQICWLAGAAVATPIWSALDRHSSGRVTPTTALRVALRFCLAAQMFSYGAAKVVPIQFPSPTPSQLAEPLGELSPMGLLWAQIGSSTSYQILLGAAEIAGGLLLVVPRTAAAGGLISAAEMAQVFALNVTFDVPVKIHSSHLSLLGLLVAALEIPRLAFPITGRPAVAAARSVSFRVRTANRISTAVQVGAGLWLLGAHLRNAWSVWKNSGDGQPKPELYGLWDVTHLSDDGQHGRSSRADRQQWQWMAVDSAAMVAVQRIDGSIDRYLAVIDVDAQTLLLTSMTTPERQVSLYIDRAADDHISLEGDIDGSLVHMDLRRRDLKAFPLVGHRFRLVQERSSLR